MIHSVPTFRIAITEPTAIDPYRAQEIEGVGIVKMLFTGLIATTAGQRLVPGIARSWECDEAGLTWIFHLRSDARFSNGEPVNATSFVRGLNRALDPAVATETAYHASGLRGFEEMQAGAASRLSGLRADGPGTLVAELTRPDFEFAAKTLQPIFSPVPVTAGPALNPAFNEEPVGNGPFMLAGPWRHGESLRLARNPHWVGPPPGLDEIQIDILTSATALDDEYDGFTDGRYDYARIPIQRVAAAREAYAGKGMLIERDLPGLHYFIPFCHRPPMDSADARRAVSLAIDRAAIAAEFFGSGRKPASSLLSPWFAGVTPSEAGRQACAFDPAAARAHAARAGLPAGARIDLASNHGADHGPWVRAIAGQLRAILGWDVRVLEMSTRELVAYRTSRAASGLCRAGWAYDYPTPDNLLFPLLHSSCTAPDADGTAHGDNEGRYASAAFDAAVERARALADPAAQAAAWAQAERIALTDLALIPLWYRTEYRVAATDRFSGIDLDFFGNPTLADVAVRPPGAGPAGLPAGGADAMPAGAR